MAALDSVALHAVTGLMRWLGGEQRLLLDSAVRFVTGTDTLKLGVPVLLAFWVRVRPTGDNADPLRVLRHVAGIALAMAVIRGAQILLPVRPRPAEALPDFPFPEVAGLAYFPSDNSFRSDHAALAFSLVAVVRTGSGRLGTVALLWAAAVVCLPRLHLGFHLSDLVAGAARSASWPCGSPWGRLCRRAPLGPSRGPRARSKRAPGLATVALFMVAFECMTLFWSSRKVADAAVTVAAMAAGHQRTALDSLTAAVPGTAVGTAHGTGGACRTDHLAGQAADPSGG